MIEQLSKLAMRVGALAAKLPPEAVPVVESLVDAGIQHLLNKDPAAARKSLQAAERKANAELAKAIVRRARTKK